MNYRTFTLLVVAITLSILGQMPVIILSLTSRTRPHYDKLDTGVMITENLLVFTFQVILIMIFNQLITRVH